MTLNLATAAFFSGLVEIALCMGMMVLWLREKARYIFFWSLGFFAFGTGSLLISLQGKLPALFSLVIANFFSTSSSVLFHIGICLFYRLHLVWLPSMAVVLSVEAGLMAYYHYIDFNAPARIYVYSFAQAFIALMTLQTLLAARRERKGDINSDIIFVNLLFLIVHGTRIIGTPFFFVSSHFLDSGNFQTLFGFGLMLTHTCYALAFGSMHAASLNAKLSTALADAKAKDRQKVEVLGYIGHDLRAPLATIRGYSKLILTEAPEKQHKLVQTIQRSVKYQLDLIDELLEYTKAELQPLAIQPTVTDLPLLLGDISEYAIALCSQQNNQFRYHASDRMPRQISLDGKRLQQVLLNLLSNAAKFTHDGVVTLSITARPDGEACALHFAVSDTGIGIDLNQDINIFGAFQQIQAASGSTGLGLFIAQHIVSAMGGSMSVASVPGQGTTFSFGLSAPVIDASDADWPVVAQPETASSKHSPESTAPQNVIPEDQALDELANLALHGRLTDIEHWIARHAHEAAYAPFVAQLRELLDHFEFSVIYALAVHHRGVDSPQK